jgi:hypothetical protein
MQRVRPCTDGGPSASRRSRSRSSRGCAGSHRARFRTASSPVHRCYRRQRSICTSRYHPTPPNSTRASTTRTKKASWYRTRDHHAATLVSRLDGSAIAAISSTIVMSDPMTGNRTLPPYSTSRQRRSCAGARRMPPLSGFLSETHAQSLSKNFLEGGQVDTRPAGVQAWRHVCCDGPVGDDRVRAPGTEPEAVEKLRSDLQAGSRIVSGVRGMGG